MVCGVNFFCIFSSCVHLFILPKFYWWKWIAHYAKHCDQLGSISLTFYEQLLKKSSQAAFCAFRIWACKSCALACWWNWPFWSLWLHFNEASKHSFNIQSNWKERELCLLFPLLLWWHREIEIMSKTNLKHL